MDFEKPDLIFKVFMFADNKVEKLVTSKFTRSLIDDDTKSTIGINFYTKDVEIEGKFIRLMVWGWSLEDQFKKVFELAIGGANGVLLIYDITNTETLNKLTEWSKLIKERKTEGTPNLLVGIKLDLEENRDVFEEQIVKFKEDYNISSSIKISLKPGENVEEMYNTITRMILNRYNIG